MSRKSKILKHIFLFILIVFLSCKSNKKEIDNSNSIKYSIENNLEYLELGKSIEVILHSKNLEKRLLKITTKGNSSFSNTYSTNRGFHLTINAKKENINDGVYEIFLTEVLKNDDRVERIIRIPVKE